MTERGLLDKIRPPHYPRAFAKNIRGREGLLRQVPVHPAQFVVGMDEPDRPLFPPHEKILGTAIQCASYIARVEEVSERGEVTVTLWERPNGREGLTVLSVDEHLDKKWPVVGDLLWIWTWVDVVSGRRRRRIHVEVETAEITNAERQELAALLERLRGVDQ